MTSPLHFIVRPIEYLGILEEHHALHPPAQVSHFTRIFDQAGVTPAVHFQKFPGIGTDSDPFIVDFLPKDPYDGLQASNSRRWMYCGIVSVASVAVYFGSSFVASGVEDFIAEFHVTSTVAYLALISSYVLGLSFGPLIAGPLSGMNSPSHTETMYGRHCANNSHITRRVLWAPDNIRRWGAHLHDLEPRHIGLHQSSGRGNASLPCCTVRLHRSDGRPRRHCRHISSKPACFSHGVVSSGPIRRSVPG